LPGRDCPAALCGPQRTGPALRCLCCPGFRGQGPPVPAPARPVVWSIIRVRLSLY